MINEVYDTLGIDGYEHPAAGSFDAHEFIDAVCAVRPRLPESDADLTWVEIVNDEAEVAGVSFHGWTGKASAIVHVSGPYPWVQATQDALMPLVLERNLMLYDADNQSVFNNRRSYS